MSQLSIKDPVDHPVVYSPYHPGTVAAVHLAEHPAHAIGGKVCTTMLLEDGSGRRWSIDLTAQANHKTDARRVESLLARGELTLISAGTINLFPAEALKFRDAILPVFQAMRRAGLRVWIVECDDHAAIPDAWVDQSLLRTATESGPIARTVARFAKQHQAQIIMPRAYRVADGIVCLTEHQAEMVRVYRPPGQVCVIPAYWDPTDVPDAPPRAPGGPVRVGFGGYPAKMLDDMPMIHDVLAELAGRPDVELHFCGVWPDPEVAYKPIQTWQAGRYEFGAGHAHFHPFINSYSSYLREISRYDIALAPLADIPVNHSRWPGHWMEHSLYGTACVVSDITPYDELEHGENVLKATSADDWRAAIMALIEQPELRKRIGETARRDVLTNYTTEAVAPLWRAWLQNAMGAERKSA